MFNGGNEAYDFQTPWIMYRNTNSQIKCRRCLQDHFYTRVNKLIDFFLFDGFLIYFVKE